MSPHPPILLGTLGMTDSLILMVMALVVFGPRRLPQIARQLGKLMYEFRKASNDFKFQMEEELRNAEEADRRKKEDARQRALAAETASEQASVSADPPPAATPVDSSHPGEGAYPAQDRAETPANDPKPELIEESGGPKILPPSTGEQVAAARPSPGYYYLPTSNGQESTPESTSPENAERAGSCEPGASPTKNRAQDAPEALNQHG